MEFDKITVKVFLINEKGEMLMQLRDEKPSIFYPGYWDLLGGGAEKGESALEAITREVKEEIGLGIQDIKKFGYFDLFEKKETFYSFFPMNDLKNQLDIVKLEEGLKHRITLFKGRLDVPAGNIDLTEGQKVEYFDMTHVLDLKIPPYLKRFIRENKKKLI
jgi:8-oxo-dGTP diphosphatase